MSHLEDQLQVLNTKPEQTVDDDHTEEFLEDNGLHTNVHKGAGNLMHMNKVRLARRFLTNDVNTLKSMLGKEAKSSALERRCQSVKNSVEAVKQAIAATALQEEIEEEWADEWFHAMLVVEEAETELEERHDDGTVPKKKDLRKPQQTFDWLEQAVKEEQSMPNDLPLNAKSSVKTELPVFTGNLLQWNNFKAMFFGLVHNTSKAPEEKLAILKTAMGREPAELIKNITGGSRAYLKALDLLQKRYGNPLEHRRLHKEMLRGLNPVREGDHRSLQQFADKVQGLISGFEDYSSNEAEELALELAEKLPFNQHSAWNMHMLTLSNPPDLESFSEWLGRLAQSTRKLEDVLPRNLKEPPRAQPKLAKSYVSNIEPDNCLYCYKQNHAIDACFKFKRLTVEDRRKAVMDKKLCFKCLDSNHVVKECESNVRCTESDCKRQHHPLLHGGFAPSKEYKVQDYAAHSKHSHVGFGIVKAKVKASGGRILEAEVMLDNGSNTTVITEDFCKKAGLKKKNKQLAVVCGVGGKNMKKKLLKMCRKKCMSDLTCLKQCGTKELHVIT